MLKWLYMHPACTWVCVHERSMYGYCSNVHIIILCVVFSILCMHMYIKIIIVVLYVALYV